MRSKNKPSKGTSREQGVRLGRRKAGRNGLVIIPVVIAVMMVAAISCASPGDGGRHDLPILATWLEPEIVGDIVSVPVSEVESNRNIHFKVETETRDMNFMAYMLNAEIYVRANVCPPCWGIGYSLDRDVLVCDMCGTTFEAATGDGIRGACVDYPKAAVPYEIIDGRIVMDKADLAIAYENTLEPGWP